MVMPDDWLSVRLRKTGSVKRKAENGKPHELADLNSEEAIGKLDPK